MKRIIFYVVIAILIALLYQVLVVYRVLSASNYRLFNLENIQQIFDNEGDKQISMKIENPTSQKVYVKDTSITIEKNGIYKGGFMPIDLKLTSGVNNLTLTFLNDTKFGLIATDYILNQLSDYKLVIRGNFLGFIPFRYKMKMNTILN